MQRRTFIQAMAASAGVCAGSATVMSESKPWSSAGASENWVGAPALASGKAYADCPLGALHYRHLGADAKNGQEESAAVLLLHQTPFGMAEWVDIQPLLAAKGLHVIAPDNPGYGMSDPAPEDVTVTQLADNLIGLLDSLKVSKVVIGGHHTGAAIAAAFAARHPGRTAAVVLHGCPLYSESERAERLSRGIRPFEPQADGSHLAEMFRAIHANAGDKPAALAASTWATLGAWQAGENSPAYRAVFANDMSSDIAGIRARTLVLTDRGDSLHEKDLQVAKMRGEFALETFSEGGSFSLMLEPNRWVEHVTSFIRQVGA